MSYNFVSYRMHAKSDKFFKKKNACALFDLKCETDIKKQIRNACA